MTTVAIVQARMGSTRLPGKVLLPLLGEPMVTMVMRRGGRAALVDRTVLATTERAEDDRLAELAHAEGWPVVRGSADDLLDRYLQAAAAHDADVIVRITSDCPLVDPAVIDATIAACLAGGADYASNTLEPRSFPRGLDVEVVTRAALERAGREDANAGWRQHATPYVYRHPEWFRLLRVPAEDDQSMHRWSVDTAADYELVRRIVDGLGRDDFGWRDALALVEAHPDWMDLNADVVQKSVDA